LEGNTGISPKFIKILSEKCGGYLKVPKDLRLDLLFFHET
jgi:hypothetical protein